MQVVASPQKVRGVRVLGGWVCVCICVCVWIVCFAAGWSGWVCGVHTSAWAGRARPHTLLLLFFVLLLHGCVWVLSVHTHTYRACKDCVVCVGGFKFDRVQAWCAARSFSNLLTHL